MGGMTYTEHYYGKTDYSYMVSGIDTKQAQTIEKMPEIENYLTVGLQYGHVSADVPVTNAEKISFMTMLTVQSHSAWNFLSLNTIPLFRFAGN